MIAVPNGLRRWFAFGSGVGIEIAGAIGAESLRVVAVRVRPNGAHVLGELWIDSSRLDAGAGVWGAEYAAFVRKHGLGHVAAGILLPRRDVIVRTLSLPGVADEDLASAVGFQLDGLHPYSDEDAVISWARVPESPAVLVAITRKETLERYSVLFSEAGVKVASFTCSAAVLASARRLWGTPAAGEVLAYESNGTGVELYGESASKPIFSAVFDVPVDRAANMAAAELRLSEETPVHTFEALLGMAPPLPSGAALVSACPGLSLSVNLLPAEQRETGSRLAWIPAAAMGAAVVVLAAALLGFPRYGEQRYLETLNTEINKVAPAANRSMALDKDIDHARRNIAMLDDLRARSQADMQVLGELTQLLPPPTWLNTLELNRTQVNLAGETAQAASLLSTLDDSPMFQGSEFSSPPVRVTNGEGFRVKANREGAVLNAGNDQKGGK